MKSYHTSERISLFVAVYLHAINDSLFACKNRKAQHTSVQFNHNFHEFSIQIMNSEKQVGPETISNIGMSQLKPQNFLKITNLNSTFEPRESTNY